MLISSDRVFVQEYHLHTYTHLQAYVHVHVSKPANSGKLSDKAS